MAPAMYGGDDLVGIGGPDEGFWVAICLGEVSVDGCLEVDDRAEGATLQGPLRERGKEGLDGGIARSRRSG